MTIALSTTQVLNAITSMTVTVHQQGEAVVIDVRGEVDLLTGPRLLETLLAAQDSGPRVVVIDLLAVGFFGASGLATLIEAQQSSRTRLRVAATGWVARQLHLIGADRRVAVYPTRDEALTGVILTAITAGPVLIAEVHHVDSGLGCALLSDD